MSPHVTGLSKRTRASVFGALVCIFILGTPLLWLYASGYRLMHMPDSAATSTSPTFVPTGGLYIGIEGDASVSLDGTPMRGSRFFRNAVYLDGVVAGTHRVVVEREGHHTWVKELTVTPQLVVEAYAFAVPSTTTVRLIAPKKTPEGVVARAASSTIAATIANIYAVVPLGTRASRALVANAEFATLHALFEDATSATSTYGSLATMHETIRSLASASTTTEVATVVIATKNSIELTRAGDDVVARYVGSVAKMPSLFCTFPDAHAVTLDADTVSTKRTFAGCDPVITIDRQQQSVIDVTWYPGAVDAVVMTREDGVFVTELDPRGGWQNTQPLVRGKGLRARVADGSVYVYDGVDVYEVVKQ